MRPSTSVSIRICSTASATDRRKSPSPLFCSSSTSAILSSLIGSSVLAGGPRKSTLSHLPGDHLPPAPNFHHERGRYPETPSFRILKQICSDRNPTALTDPSGKYVTL